MGVGEGGGAGSSRGTEAAQEAVRRKPHTVSSAQKAAHRKPRAGNRAPKTVHSKPRTGSRAQVVYFFCLDYSDPGEREREREREGEREGRERDSGTSAFSLYDVVTVHAKVRLCCH